MIFIAVLQIAFEGTKITGYCKFAKYFFVLLLIQDTGIILFTGNNWGIHIASIYDYCELPFSSYDCLDLYFKC